MFEICDKIDGFRRRVRELYDAARTAFVDAIDNINGIGMGWMVVPQQPRIEYPDNDSLAHLASTSDGGLIPNTTFEGAERVGGGLGLPHAKRQKVIDGSWRRPGDGVGGDNSSALNQHNAERLPGGHRMDEATTLPPSGQQLDGNSTTAFGGQEFDRLTQAQLAPQRSRLSQTSSTREAYLTHGSSTVDINDAAASIDPISNSGDSSGVDPSNWGQFEQTYLGLLELDLDPSNWGQFEQMYLGLLEPDLDPNNWGHFEQGYMGIQGYTELP